MNHRHLGRVALVHDYLNQKGGAERVVLAFTQIFPDAPLYTSLYRPTSTFPGFANADIRTSVLDRIPVDKGFRALLPLYPAAFAKFGPIDADIVLASSSGWAHAARAAGNGRVHVYCHTPARWLYAASYLGAGSRKQKAIGPLRPWLRRWDHRAAHRADHYIANSVVTQTRLRSIYGIEAPILSPPVDVGRMRPSPRGERLLVVSRLLPYKRVDLVVEAASREGIALDVVGTGPVASDLRRMAGTTVTFHGSVDDATVTELIQGCRALCVPGVEDFGITSVEAQAAGKPVIAFGAGGALETVDEGLTGTFFHEPTADALLGAIRACDRVDTDPAEIARRAARFSTRSFAERLVDILASTSEPTRSSLGPPSRESTRPADMSA